MSVHEAWCKKKYTPIMYTDTVMLSVRTIPAITINPHDSIICALDTASFEIQATGTGLTFQWQVSLNGGATWVNQANGGVYSGMTSKVMKISNALTSMNNYRYRCIVMGCAPDDTSSSALLTVRVLPTFNTGPLADVHVCEGGDSAIVTTASGHGLAIQWQMSSDEGSSWGNLSNVGYYTGTSALTLNIAGVDSGIDSNLYRALYSGTCAPNDTSAEYALIVDYAPTITGMPASIYECAANIAYFDVDVSGAELDYQWQLSTNQGGSWSNLSDVGLYSHTTQDSLLLATTLLSMDSNLYRAKITGRCGLPIYSDNAGLYIADITPLITVQPADTNACTDSNAIIFVTASGSYISYQWQLSTNNAVTWNNITNNATYSGATNDTLFINAAQPSMNNYVYRCLISSSCPPATVSDSAYIHVGPTSVQSLAINWNVNPICLGSAMNFTATPTDPGPSPVYQWYVNTVAVGTDTTAYNYNPAIGDSIYCKMTSLGSCVDNNPAFSDTLYPTLYVLPVATISVDALSDTICDGFNTSLIVDFTAGLAPFSIVYSNGAINDTLSGVTDPYSFAPSPLPIWIAGKETEYTYTLPSIQDANGCVSLGTGTPKVWVAKRPETGPAYFVPNLYNE